jgi:CRP/FNR family transcriptional regulator, cyclic AMP receptor protein
MEWPMLAILPTDVRAAVVAAARRCHFAKHEVVFHEGDIGDAVHLIREGRFAVSVNNESGEATTLRVLGPGDAFGELALVHPRRSFRSATVTALEAAETVSISGRSFTSLRSRYAEMDRFLVHLLAEQVEELSERLLEVLFLGVERRVYRRLIELAEMYGSGSRETHIPLTQDTLAGMAGTTRPTANQILRRLADEGTVTLRRGGITISNPERLRQRGGSADRLLHLPSQPFETGSGATD